MNATQYVMLFCAVSFLGYGLSCIFSHHMVVEFERYKLARFRKITGALQLIAAAGLLVGLIVPWVGGLAAWGLSLQMACGLGVRVKIKDPWYLCLPAASYMLLCSWIALRLF